MDTLQMMEELLRERAGQTAMNDLVGRGGAVSWNRAAKKKRRRGGATNSRNVAPRSTLDALWLRCHCIWHALHTSPGNRCCCVRSCRRVRRCGSVGGRTHGRRRGHICRQAAVRDGGQLQVVRHQQARLGEAHTQAPRHMRAEPDGLNPLCHRRVRPQAEGALCALRGSSQGARHTSPWPRVWFDVQVANLIHTNAVDIVSASWVLACVEAGELKDLEPRYLIHMCPKTRFRLRKTFDDYGDHYTRCARGTRPYADRTQRTDVLTCCAGSRRRMTSPPRLRS